MKKRLAYLIAVIMFISTVAVAPTAFSQDTNDETVTIVDTDDNIHCVKDIKSKMKELKGDWDSKDDFKGDWGELKSKMKELKGDLGDPNKSTFGKLEC